MRPYLTLHDPARARAWHDAGFWRYDTFYSLVTGHAARRPDDFALRDGDKRLSWAEVLGRVDATTAMLSSAGLTAGDVVSIWAGNRIEGILLFLACSRQGLACNPSLHRTHTCAEIVTLLNRLGTAAFMTEPGWGADRDENDLVAMLADVPTLKTVLQPDTFPTDLTADLSTPADNPDSVAYLAFTSGTTGAPKCVMHSSNTLLANGRDMVADWGLDHNSRILSLSPLSHHIAWVAVAEWLVSGGELITDHRSDGVSVLDWIIETGATYVLGVPTHAMDLLAEQRRRGINRLGEVQTFYMAGAPIPPSVAEAFVDQNIRPQNVYGMTENSSHQYTHPGDATDVVLTTCGRGGGAYKVRIFDSDNPDQPVPAGTVGQIAGQGPCLMLGYFDNQQATDQSFNRDGWFLSGDLGSMDADGNLRVEGRLKDLIIRGGHNIYPSQIEALAIRHPAIEKCAAIPVPDERLGEKVCLSVIGDVDGPAVLAHLREQGLSKYDMPEYFLGVEEFPLTASGKILKRELEQMVRRGELVPEPVG